MSNYDDFDELIEISAGSSGEMKDEIFFGKLIINALENWTNSYGDDSVLRGIIDHNTFLHGTWTEEVAKRKDDAIAEEERLTGYRSMFMGVNKFLNKEDILRFTAEMRRNIPGVNEELALSDSTRLISELLELNHAESLMFETAQRLYEGIDYDLYRTLGNIGNLDVFKDRATLIEKLYGVSKEEAISASKGFLVEAGLVIEGRGPTGFYNVNTDLAPAFSIKGLTTDKLETALFPSAIKTTLTIADYPHISKEIDRTKNAVNKALATADSGANIMLWGEPGTGKTELAMAMAKDFGWDLKIVGDISMSDASEKSRSARIASLKLATKLFARNPNTVILFDEIEDLFKIDNNANFSKAFINRIIETSPVPIIWTTNSLLAVGDAVLRRMIFNIHLEVPPAGTRELMWKKYSRHYGLDMDDKVIANLSDTYDISPALIHNAAKVAHAALSEAERLNPDSIVEIISSLDRLVHYGQKRDFPKPRKDEETYDPSCSNTDRDLSTFTTSLLRARPDFSLLLYGASGTGKSEYAKWLAKRMGRKVLFRKASDLLDKYVGGTEENIAAAFAEAKASEKFLIIDEADTFLRNRSKAERSWEVSQVNQMLTEMESHDQPFAMTTNLKDEIDPASIRRFTFKLKFDFMKPEQSVRLFKTFFGFDAPNDIRRIHHLAPGDFANVRKQVEALQIDDEAEIYRLLLEEVEEKGINTSKVGF